MSMTLNSQRNQLLILFRKMCHFILDIGSICYSHSRYTVTLSAPVKSTGSQFLENPINSKANKGFNKYEAEWSKLNFSLEYVSSYPRSRLLLCSYGIFTVTFMICSYGIFTVTPSTPVKSIASQYFWRWSWHPSYIYRGCTINFCESTVKFGANRHFRFYTEIFKKKSTCINQ